MGAAARPCRRDPIACGAKHDCGSPGRQPFSLGLDYWRDEDVQYDPNRKVIVEAGDTRWLTDADLSEWTVISFAKPQ